MASRASVPHVELAGLGVGVDIGMADGHSMVMYNAEQTTGVVAIKRHVNAIKYGPNVA